MTRQSRSLTIKLQNKNGHAGLRNLGTITVHAEETIASRNAVEIKFRCSHLDNKDLFSKSVCIWGSYTDGILLHKFLCSYFSFFLLLAGSFLENIKDCWEWRFCSNLQNRSREQQSQSHLEAPNPNYAAIWKQGKLVIVFWLEVKYILLARIYFF